ncbi:MAG: thrombospondin type 3 repeat-containing protein [Candidatus Zixiibacteriota bacterium]
MCRAALRRSGRFGWSRLLGLVGILAAAAVPSGAHGACDYATYIFFGEDNFADFGSSVQFAGDVNNDGYDDIVIGAPVAGDNESGEVYVYSGRTGRLLRHLLGAAALDKFGAAVSTAGDVDGDGYDDLLIGAPDNDAVASGAGRAYVYSGQNWTLLYSLNGQAANDHFGFSVAYAGDVNGDSNPDVIVGATGNSAGGTAAGRAYVYSGPTGSLIWTFTGPATASQLGNAVSGAVDVNNDTFDDLIVGAYFHNAGTGRVYVYSGADATVLHTFNGAATFDGFGFSVAGLRDINADGYDDVIVGARNHDFAATDAGRVYVYSGQTGGIIWTFDGVGVQDYFGVSVARAGDVNSDGIDDILAGGYGYNQDGVADRGLARIFSGQTGSLLFEFIGVDTTEWFGFAVAGGGDASGDGRAEVIVGALLEDSGGNDAGAAYLFRPADDLDGDLITDVCDPDVDGDLVANGSDNCSQINNPGQEDADADGVGDVCDNCPNTYNPDQSPSDADNDGVPDDCDNCPAQANAGQEDADGDGSGNVCDLCPGFDDNADADGDNAPDGCDICPGFNDFAHTDGDGIPDGCDNCPTVANPDQLNTDLDALGNACDPDDDGDGIQDPSDNCPLIANSNQANNDGDSQGDACDTDDDNDGVPDTGDNCPFAANANQLDSDTDGQGDVCDTDDDNDGVADGSDNCPLVVNPGQANNDGDPQGDACDADDDNDGFTDDADNCPLAANASQLDTDLDGQGDACDTDDDNDGVADVSDNCPLVANAGQEDFDGNGVGDACCCVGNVGDANGSGEDEPTIGDVTTLIDAKFITGTCVGVIGCLPEADINQSAPGAASCDDITIGDITNLIDYLFITGFSLGLPDCL